MKYTVELWRTDTVGYGCFTIGTYDKLEDARTVVDSIKDCAEAADKKERFKIEIRAYEEVSVGPQEERK